MFSPNVQLLSVIENDWINTTSNKLKLEKEFLMYLDQEEILRDLQVSGNLYEKSLVNSLKKPNFIPPFRFKFTLDLMKLQEISEKLYDFFIKEPNTGLDLAKKVIFYGLRFILTRVQLSMSDLQVIPLVINLPVTREISDLIKYPSYGLESVQGILMSKTTMTNYVRSSVYSCGLSYCPNTNWQRYWQDFGIVCPECLSLMEKNVSSSDTGEEIICQFISLRAYQSLGLFQVLNVSVKDELCFVTDLNIGDEYKVTGKLNKFFSFEAMNIQTRESGSEFFFPPSVPSNTIVDIYHKISAVRPNCPWSFVHFLSSSLGSHLIPISSYLHLKMGLLLSLCTQKNNEGPVPLIAIGADSLYTQHLFQIAGKLSKRYVSYSTSHSYLGGAAKPGLQSDVIWLEAGQLILAATGVCNLGDWSKFKKEQADYICQTIESGQIVLNKGDVGKTNLIDFVELKCAVWTYWCHITTSRSHQSQLKKLINVFGIPFLAEEKNEHEVQKICIKNLEKTTKKISNTATEFIPLNDLKEYIEMVNLREVTLTDEATQLISNYFVVSRQKRPQCLPLGAVKTITSLAEAHARLALRHEVLYEDVIRIIYLYEEAISTYFGESIYSFKKFNWNENEPIYVYVGKQLQEFKIWLESYISR